MKLLFAIVLTGMGAQAAELCLLPEGISLDGAEARHGVLAVRMDDGFAGSGEKVVLRSSDDTVVRIEGGQRVVPVKDGVVTVTGTALDGATAAIQVTVTGMAEGHEWSFRNDVMPVLTKSTCNSGGCHGALAGKGGFRLSLMGYDIEADFQTITRGVRGRRIDLAQPAHSLLLTKPTAATKHKGGKLIDTKSLDYRILAEWVAAGAPGPKAEDERVRRIEVLPSLSLLKPGERQQLMVRAHYSDGRVMDVTRWAKFTSSNEAVATVDPKLGLVSVIGHGEGAVTAWFDSQIVLARLTSPFAHDLAALDYAKEPRRNVIDD